MFLTDSSRHHHNHHLSAATTAAAVSHLFQTFEQTLRHRLLSLVPAEALTLSLNLPFLSSAIDVLAATIADAKALISDMSISDPTAISTYLDSSICLLDFCNSVSAEIESLQRELFLIRFALHLVSSGKVQKARNAISEWEETAEKRSCHAGKLIGGYATLPKSPSAIWRTIYAVEAVSSLVCAILIAYLGGKGGKLLDVMVSGEFSWAPAFDDLRSAVSGVICQEIAGEVRDVECDTKRLVEVMDEVDNGEEKMRIAAEELKESAERATEGLDRLGDAVNRLFRSAMSTRTAAVDRLRMGPQNCK